MLVFVTGGVRSGKSAAAEAFVQKLMTNRAVYLATSRVTDHEMQERISLHQQQRNDSNLSWSTLEVPKDLSGIYSSIQETDVILLDCATNWLANELFTKEEKWQSHLKANELFNKMVGVIHQLNKRCQHLIIVSNELFEESVLKGPTFTYMKLLGRIHQEIVNQADLAICVEAGISCYYKGDETAWQ